MVKLQITLTNEEASLLSKKAKGLGYDVTKYAKFVLAKEAQEAQQSVPVFEASKATEKLINQAIKEDESGSTKTWPRNAG